MVLRFGSTHRRDQFYSKSHALFLLVDWKMKRVHDDEKWGDVIVICILLESWSASWFHYWCYYWLIRNSLNIWSQGNGELSRFASHHIVWTLWKRNEESLNGSDRYLYWYASIVWRGWPVASPHALSLPSILTLLKRNEVRKWTRLSLRSTWFIFLQLIWAKVGEALVNYCLAFFLYCGNIGSITVLLYFSAPVSLHWPLVTLWSAHSPSLLFNCVILIVGSLDRWSRNEKR